MVRTGTTARAAGLLLGAGLDALLGDPRRGHPVAGFGRAAAALEKAIYRDDRARGALFTGICAGTVLGAAVLAERAGRDRPVLRCLTTAAATWAVLGGTSLAREGEIMARHLEGGHLGAARLRLSHLCARDPSGLDGPALARATVESLAENTGDAVVSPLFWGAVAGVPGLAAYRALNTLDAMVGYRSARYANFGWASARLDDAANWLPARLTGALTVLAAPAVTPVSGGRLRASAEAWRVLRRDGARHPSPNAGRCEAAAAGALGVRLGGANTYAGEVETRPALGDGRDPDVPDIRRAVRLTRAVSAAAVAASAGLAFALGRARHGRAR
ncbi:adenosylcobinamide-phosphate synthase [Actinocorallia herbida]|uniref:Cobalamin biosynthesis protein CobD n=1 Tax=Actinocorallia herbida TaxID=58109 RepID=A0A3N1D7Q0_9ACTN|nr:cobalamin biosynthesis protein [Actinocorallia herbida]ROO89552.1 adenosylcobinamide-phosphate synthase [Actinocorallia herbida]